MRIWGFDKETNRPGQYPRKLETEVISTPMIRPQCTAQADEIAQQPFEV